MSLWDMWLFIILELAANIWQAIFIFFIMMKNILKQEISEVKKAFYYAVYVHCRKKSVYILRNNWN